jgi:hypothetical protein
VGTIRRTLVSVAKRAGLKKKVYPHLFRHSRLTLNAKFMTEAELCVFAGWKPGSPQTRVYVHLSGVDIDDKILAHYGLREKKTLEKAEKTLKPILCPRCSEVNPATGRFCFKCGSYLTLDEALKAEEEKKGELETLKREMADQQQNIINLRIALSDIERMLRSNKSGN